LSRCLHTLFRTLYYSGLTGSIDPAVGELTMLTYLNFYNNDLQGTIPESVGDLTALTQLLLNGNQRLTGTVPSSFTQLTNLAALYLTGYVCKRVAFGLIPELLATT
jgi:Leucine-rich repeat (LRR) protein